MRPLSICIFFRHNKKKLISNVIIIVVAICFVYIMECFVASIVQSIYPLDANRFEYASVIISTEAVPEISQEMIDSTLSSENIERTMPISIQKINFSVPGSSTHPAVLGIDYSDLSYLSTKYKIELYDGRMPEEGTKEIAVDWNAALNNNLQIGSQVGSDIDKTQPLNGTYTVVGILKSDSHISIVGAPGPNDSTLANDEKGYFIFPNEGCFEAVEDEVTAFTRQGLYVWTLTLYNKAFAKNSQTFKILDTMVILVIVVMVICLVCSKYAQYFSRKSEIGVLNALGYTRREITARIFREEIITNLIGFIVGLTLAILLCKIILAAYFDSIGGTGVYLYGKAAAMSLPAPLLTTIFTLIPLYRLIGRFDAISIVEDN